MAETIAQSIRPLKKRWARDRDLGFSSEGRHAKHIRWQGAYGAFTVSKQDVPQVTAYVERQKQHHTGNELWDEWEQTLIEEDGAVPGG